MYEYVYILENAHIGHSIVHGTITLWGYLITRVCLHLHFSASEFIHIHINLHYCCFQENDTAPFTSPCLRRIVSFVLIFCNVHMKDVMSCSFGFHSSVLDWRLWTAANCQDRVKKWSLYCTFVRLHYPSFFSWFHSSLHQPCMFFLRSCTMFCISE